MTKKFTLMQLFSVVDGRLSNAGMDSVYDILNWVTDSGKRLRTHHLPTAMDYLEKKNPEWYRDITLQLAAMKPTFIAQSEIEDEFQWYMDYIQKNNHEFEIPQLKDEFDTSDFGQYMTGDSLLRNR